MSRKRMARRIKLGNDHCCVSPAQAPRLALKPLRTAPLESRKLDCKEDDFNARL